MTKSLVILTIIVSVSLPLALTAAMVLEEYFNHKRVEKKLKYGKDILANIRHIKEAQIDLANNLISGIPYNAKGSLIILNEQMERLNKLYELELEEKLKK